MTPLFWCIVVILTLLLGAFLPKILHVFFRLALYVVAFLVILWLCAHMGITPENFGQKVKAYFHKDTTKSEK